MGFLENNRLISRIKQIPPERRSFLLNIYLAFNFLVFAGWELYGMYRNGTLDYIEIAYAAQTCSLIVFIIIRTRHKAIDPSPFHQAVALAAFFSGVLFIGQEPTGGESVKQISQAIICASNVLGLVTVLNLGRSFGIMIALRKVRTGGLYSIVRHPMYGTDILLRIGYIVSHLTPVSIALAVFSVSCYVYRAVLEEKFLCRDEEYRQYMKKVRYRFIPFIF